ncbi:MAG TPA: autotransporter-associated beta strand repeat-containing protein [Verrucomicrobiae bacterium]
MKTNLPSSRRSVVETIFLAGLVLIALPSNRGWAATQTWSGAGANNSWQNGANWLSGTPPLAGDALTFTGTARTANTNDFPVGTPFDGIGFSSPAGAFTLWGNPIRLDGDITDNQALLTETINLPVVLGGNRTVDVAKDAVLRLGGVVSGGPALTKTGPGLLTLSATNTISGPVTVLGGTVSVSSDGNLGTAPGVPTAGNLVLNGGALRGTANLTLAGARGIAVGSAALGGWGRIEVDSGATLTYRGVIDNNGGTGGLTKGGPGTLTLSSANLYTGVTSNRVGNLTLDFTQADSPLANIISASSALSLGGENTGIGTVNNIQFTMNGKAGAASSQTFNGTSFDVGSSLIRANSGAGGSANLSLGPLGHLPGGVVTFITPEITGGSGDILTASANVNGILGGWATMSGAGQTVNGIVVATNWASVDAGGGIVPYQDFTVYASGTIASQVNAAANLIFNTSSGPGSSILVDADHEPGAGTTTDLNSITINALPSFGINIGSNNVLRLGKYGGIFLAAVPSTANNNYELGNGTDPGNNPGANAGQNVGTLTAGGAPDTDGELVFTINSSSQTANGSIYVEAAVTDNGNGKVSVVKTGPGPMKFRGHNSFSGNMYILQGRIQMAGSELPGGAAVTANPDAFGRGDIYVLPGGQAFPSGAGGNATMPAITNNWFIAGNGVSDNVGAIRLSGVFSNGVITLIGDARLGGGGAATGVPIYDRITGPFNLDFGATGNSGSGGNGAIIFNQANDWSGNTTIVGRTGGTAGNTRLALGASQVIPDGFGKGNVVLGNSGNTASTCTLDLNGFDETINGLVSTGNAANDFVQNNAAGTTSTLTLGNNDQTAAFGGVIQDLGGIMAITKIGRGIQTLTGVNTYSGATTVNGGTLALTGAGSFANSQQIFVNPGAALDVSGVPAGFSTFYTLALTNGTLSIGTTGGSGINNLILHDSILQVPINPATVNIQATTLTLGGAANLVNISAVSGVAQYPAIFTLIKYGSLLGSAPNFGLGTVPTPTTRGYFSNDTVNASIVLVLLDGPKPLTWTGAAGYDWDFSSVNWLAFGLTPTAFMNADSAVFTDTAATNVVNLTTILRPGAITAVNQTMDYTFVGNGGLSGAATLVKDGAGSLTVANSGVNDFTGGIVISNGTLHVGSGGTAGNIPAGSLANYGALVFSRSDGLTVSSDISGTGTVIQNGPGTTTLSGANTYDGLSVAAQGTLRAGSANALGSTLGGTVVSNGAALDVNGRNLGLEAITVSGSGVGDAGAIINSGSDQINALQTVTLTGDTTFGGTGRWDIRGTGSSLTTGGTPYTLTKTGSNQVSFVAVSVDSLARINVQQGLFGLETTTTFYGTTIPVIDVAEGATLQLWNGANPFNNNIVLHGDGATTILNNGAGANTLGGTVTLNGNCLIGAAGTSLTLNGTLGGGGGLAKVGGSQLILAGTTSYSGATVVTNGTLMLLASKGPGGGISVYGGTLAGFGPIAERVTIAAGGTLSPGDPTSTPGTTLNINNSLSLAGTTVMDITKIGSNFSSSDQIAGVTSLTLGGTLQVILAGDPLAVGDSIKLFGFNSASGSFASIFPARAGTNLVWDVSQLAVDGTLKVAEAPAEIGIGSITSSGSDVIIRGDGGPAGGTYYVLSSTNLALPAAWVPVATNLFDDSGAFAWTNAIETTSPQRFFRLQLP